MKTALISLAIATLLGLVSQITGRSFGAAELTSVLFVTGLLVWTFKQYSRQEIDLVKSCPIHLSAKFAVQRLQNRTTNRLAA
jgi:hypothetical protein